MSEELNNLYKVIADSREQQARPYSRLLYAGYVNELSLQKEKTELEGYLTEVVRYIPGLNGYLYLKGLFYLHMLESDDPSLINSFMKLVFEKHLKSPTLHHNLNILYQSFENPNRCFKTWICENIFQTGPMLSDSDKTQQQIQERAYEIYSKICEGALKKQNDPSSKIANECPLNVDDMCMMVHNSFMTIEEYHDMYIEEFQVTPDSEEQFPMRPGVLKYMEFMDTNDYTQYSN